MWWRVWTIGWILALPVAVLETAVMAAGYQDLGIGDRGRFLIFYGASILALVSAVLGLSCGLMCSILGESRRPQGIRMGVALGALLLLLTRLAMTLATGHLKVMSVPGGVGILLALAGALAAGAAGHLLARRRWGRSGIAAIALAALLAAVLFATRFTDYPPLASPAGQTPAELTSPSILDRSNLLIISIDTLRADHLPSYGYPRETAPALQRIARRGVLFEAISQRTMTAGSIATILTGTYPPTHGVLDNREILQDGNLSLAEILGDDGYYTLAANSNLAVGAGFNFHQGFREYISSETMYEEMLESRHLNDLVLPAFDRDKDRRFFFWLHYKDPHRPYLVPEDYRELYTSDALAGMHGEHPSPTGRAFGGREKTEDYYRNQELDFVIAQYDAEIKFNDESIATVFEKLSEHDLWDDTLVVITSDHGEGLGEHGVYFEHGRTTYDHSARVPLIFYHPKLPGGRRVERPVSLVDLAPTVLELLGVPPPPQMEGQSFAGAVLGRDDAPSRSHHFIIGAHRYGYHTHAVRTESHKLILDVDKRWLPFDALVERAARGWLPARAYHIYRCRRMMRELYDLDEDPEEQVNLVELDPELADRLTKVLRGWMDTSYGQRRESVRRDVAPEIDEMLRALGYVD
ncbi:MAG: sulfatase [bacterium]|nr:sulfatase [bacterium]